MQRVKINLNANTNLQLTKEGRQVLEEHLKELTLPRDLGSWYDLSEDGRVSMTLWEVMLIFGPETFVGQPNLFEDSIIEVELRDD